MRAIIGSYRGNRYVPRLLESVEKYVTGIDSLTFIDDSPQGVSEFKKLGRVVWTEGAGYNTAMRAACAVGAEQDEPIIWLEEDFWFTEPTDFNEMRTDLESQPHWAQIVVQREAYYPREIQYGGIIGENKKRGKKFQSALDRYWEHTAFFSGNPSIWIPEVSAMGWPQGEGSEALITSELLNRGYKFALTKKITCAHDGEHLGLDY